MMNEMGCPEGSARANTIVLTDAPRTTAILRASVTTPGAAPAVVVAVAMAVALGALILWMSRSGSLLDRDIPAGLSLGRFWRLASGRRWLERWRSFRAHVWPT